MLQTINEADSRREWTSYTSSLLFRLSVRTRTGAVYTGRDLVLAGSPRLGKWRKAQGAKPPEDPQSFVIVRRSLAEVL
jgi:hypothetical protein